MADGDHKTLVGPASSVQISVLAMLLVGVGGGALWVGKSSAEFETLKTIVQEIRTDVRELTIRVQALPQIQRGEPKNAQ